MAIIIKIAPSKEWLMRILLGNIIECGGNHRNNPAVIYRNKRLQFIVFFLENKGYSG